MRIWATLVSSKLQIRIIRKIRCFVYFDTVPYSAEERL